MDCSFLADWLPAFSIHGSNMLGAITDFAMPLAQAADNNAVLEKVAVTSAGAAPVEEGISWKQYGALAIALAVMILPFIVGSRLAKMFKMPNYGTRFGFVILAILASVVILVQRLPGLGVDLRGGTILVYEIDPSKNIGVDGDTGTRIKSEDLIEPLTRRINPSGTREIVLRPYGETEIEVIVPEVDQREVDQIKIKMAEAGILRFAILNNQRDHSRQIDLARTQADSPEQNLRTQSVVQDVDGTIVGRWAAIDRELVDEGELAPFRVNVGDAVVRNPQTGAIIQMPPSVMGENGETKQAQWVDQQGMSGLEVLMIVDPLLDVKGEDLAFTTSTYDQNGAPAVAFNLTDQGSGKFFALTTNNAPTGTFQRQLGIVLDDKLLSAPNILQPIRKEGRITGRFTREEVDSLVAILKAGQLPAALTKQPIAENQIDATLGADTIKKGVYAIGTSLALVLVFILFYYRFAGVVACIALILNLAMILATMVLINQPLTLPGLAGLVLTVGMSVDANVLIFERIREELKKGAADRMAVRNGFAKATVTIVDANLTTLITAIVLYAIGTDQIRGFAVTLILGILFSMFTAIYMSRTFFDFAERHGFLTLSMSDGVNSLRSAVSGDGNLDFIGKGKLTLALSAVLICVGVGSLFARGNGILDIDFAGGSSVQFKLDKPTDSETVRSIVGKVMDNGDDDPIDFTVNGVSMEGADAQTVYKVDSSFEEVDQLKDAIRKAFEEDGSVGLVSYNVAIKPADQSNASKFKSRSKTKNGNGVMLTAFYPQDDVETDAAADPPTDEADSDSAASDDATAADATAALGDDPEGDTGNTGTVETPGTLTYSTAIMELGIASEKDGAAVNEATLIDEITRAAETASVPLNEKTIELTPQGEGADEWSTGSSLTFSKWKIRLPMKAESADKIMANLEQNLGTEPVWISSSKVGKRVAGDMISRALGSLFASLLCIIGYIWFRFQRVIYGLAAVAALLHDVLITLGAIAVSYWLADALGFLLIDPFKISLTVVAALLTIIGYSLNDTIVVFDRIRETKGKAPRLTGEMINTSINQTLSRTLLTSVTTLIVVVLLYAFGGEGIHAFAFALVVGVLVGTYSSIFVASPILLWLIERQEGKDVAGA
ncbi:protein translocase subunit SecD [Stieleria marina]|uniref:Multifunctional fusion protein n=1 Tax=Stieleria marina TaxID=1930275 RepID=A0A517NS00_9BACT|nr:bifunctional preprotein translocase subunit SecD/SecF [Planctomycetes bacterium K23_9]